MEPEIQPVSNHELTSVAPASSHQPAGTELPNEATETTQESPQSRLKHTTSLIALFSTTLISALNTTIVATAIPSICKDLKSAEGYAWIGGAYLLGEAASTPIWAKFSDIWGRKIIMLCAVAGFFGSSVVCALSANMTMLIAGRALQGAFGGGLDTLSSIVVSDLFSMRRRSLYMGLLELTWSFAGGLGPVLGGVFVQRLTWRWIFWVMLPPCGMAFALLALALNVHNPRTSMIDGLKAIDWAGSLSMLSVLVMFLLGLSLGGVEDPWNSPTVVCLIVIGALMSIVFVFSEKKLARYPIMPLGIFASKSNLAVLIAGFAQNFALVSAEFYLPLFFQSAKLLSPINAGTLILPSVLSASLVSVATGLYIDRTGRYLELFALGLAMMAGGQGSYLSWTPWSPLSVLVGTQLLAGAGAGLLFTPPLIAIQASVAQEDVGTATATISMVRNVATVLALVCGQVIFQQGMNEQQGQLVAAGLNETLRDSFQGSKAAASVELLGSIADPTQRLVVEQAFSDSMKGLWIMNLSLLVVGLLCSAFVVKTKLSKDHVETRTGLAPEKASQGAQANATEAT